MNIPDGHILLMCTNCIQWLIYMNVHVVLEWISKKIHLYSAAIITYFV